MGCWFQDNEDLKCLPLVMWAISSFGEVGYLIFWALIFPNVVLVPQMGKHGLHDFFPSQNGIDKTVTNHGQWISHSSKNKSQLILGPWPISCLRAKL